MGVVNEVCDTGNELEEIVTVEQIGKVHGDSKWSGLDHEFQQEDESTKVEEKKDKDSVNVADPCVEVWSVECEEDGRSKS